MARYRVAVEEIIEVEAHSPLSASDVALARPEHVKCVERIVRTVTEVSDVQGVKHGIR